MSNYRIPSDYQNDKPRANHNWSVGPCGPIHPCVAYPIHNRHLNAGDRIRCHPQALIQSQALQGPLLNGFKYTTIAVFMPDSVLYGWMRNGIRYTPEQLMAFPKLYFDPHFTNSSTSPNYLAYRLSLGLKIPIPNEGRAMDFWTLDYYDPELKNDFNHVGRGGLWDWLGVPPGAVYPIVGTEKGRPQSIPSFQWSVAPAICYFLACYYYFANMQESKMYYTKNAYWRSRKGVSVGAVNQPYYGLEALSDTSFDNVMAEVDPNSILQYISLLQHLTVGTKYPAELGATDGDYGYDAGALTDWLHQGVGAHGGLFSVPYSPDLFGNIIKAGTSPTAWIDVEDDPIGANDMGAVAVPELRLKTKLQNVLDRYFVSQGRWGDVLRTLMGVKFNPYTNKPEFLGAWQAFINPTNVVATSPGESSDSGRVVDVGEMAGRIDRYVGFDNRKGVDYYARESGTFMLITALLPQPAYAQGLHPDLLAGTFGDDFNPEWNGLGFQAVPRHRYSMMPTNLRTTQWQGVNDDVVLPVAFPDPNQLTIGEEAAFEWLRTDYSRLHGEFAQNGVFQYWTLVRNFTEVHDFVANDSNGEAAPDDPDVQEYYGTYGNPMSWQYLFAGTSLLDPNFTLLTNLNITVTSAVSKHYMPYLGK